MLHHSQSGQAVITEDPSTLAPQPGGYVLRFNARTATLIFVAIEVVLVVTFVALSRLRVLDHRSASMFNLDLEGNIPAWFSGVMFCVAAVPAAIRGLQMRHADPQSPYRIYLVAAAGLAFLSMDEVGQVHDHLDRKVALGLYAGAGLFALAVLWREAVALLREPAGRTSLIVGVLAFLFGAVIMDQFSPHKWWSPERAVEEFFEMFGATMLFYGLASRVRPFGVSVVAPERPR
jgi:hypothetical protein